MKKIYRSKTDRWLTGLCGGIGEFFRINPIFFRILMLVFACSFLGIIAYFVVSYFIPEQGDNRIEAEFTDNDDKPNN